MRLVLCDDNRIFCEALAVALEARGHRALAIATTADESVAAVARYQPDACLLDLRFHSGGDGLGAARMIRDLIRKRPSSWCQAVPTRRPF